MPEHDPAVHSYVHLANFPRANEALHSLKKIASIVKPIMRARKWQVKELAEFYPNQDNLLGLNINKGQKICLRLRHPSDRNQFMPFESVVDTMLHELSHIVHGPHNQHFHALWDKLRDEHQGLLMKGYTGEGFLSEGQRLGGTRISNQEARRLARQAAEKRRVQPQGTGSGRRLGGSVAQTGQDIRQVIAAAAERRKRTLEGCGTQRLSEREIIDISELASKNGFRTQAEEDDANDVAIAQALWELEEEEKGIKPSSSSDSTSSAAPRNKRSPVTESDKQKEPATSSSNWVCAVCTLHNPWSFLCCDACGSERVANRAPQAPNPEAKKAQSGEVIDLTGDSPRKNPSAGPRPSARVIPPKQQEKIQPPPEKYWQCNFCDTAMERQWWTCSSCGHMKDNSR